MPAESSRHGASTRRPVIHGGSRIPGLYERTLKDGTTIYDYRIRIDGDLKRGTIKNAQTKTDAVREFRGLLADRDRGVEHENRLMNPTVAELMDEYLAALQARVGIKDENLRRSAETVRGYRRVARVHIEPLMGRMRVTDVDIRDVRRLLEHVQGLGRAPATVSHVLHFLTTALEFAQDSGYVERNVARDLPRKYRPGSKRQSDPRYLTAAEVDRLLAASPDHYRPVWACCVYAGLRINETLGLQWECVDFKANTIEVRQQAAEDGAQLVPHPKTSSSAATVPMMPALKRELLAHRSRLAGKDLQRTSPGAFLFVSKSGRLLASRNTLNALLRIANDAGLNPPGVPRLGQHDLRHTCAALALQAGANPVEVAELMRHSSPAITMSTYAGITAEGKGGAARKMVDAGFGV